MFTRLKGKLNKGDIFLVLSFIAGLIPASFIIHIISVDFSGFYFQALSFLNYKSHAYQILTSYCDNPVNTGVNARAPFVPFVLAISIAIFGRNLLGIYFPFFIARILIFPFTYLTARNYLSKKLAFFATVLLLFIPKLQTYSFSAFEADIFIALFYVLALYFYQKSIKLKDKKYLFLISISLGLAALSKSTGFAVAIGFVISVFLENIKNLKNPNFIKRFYLFVLIFTLIIGPYILWTIATHHQIYLTTHKDKSIFYISTNLPSLILTIPNYLGIVFVYGIKAKIISAFLLIFFIIGITKAIYKKWLTLILPTLSTLILISLLSTCLIGGNIVGSYEFITLLGFSMIASCIILLMGVESFFLYFWRIVFHRRVPLIVVAVFSGLIIYKYINNYFTSPYTLEFIPGEYYISLPTVLKNKEQIHDVRFKMENGLRLFDGPISHREIRKQFNNYRFDPFSLFYKALILGFTFISFTAVIIKNEK